jgi:hypothetical protein
MNPNFCLSLSYWQTICYYISMMLTTFREIKLFFDVVVARREQAALELKYTGGLRGGKSFTPELKEHNKKQAAELKANIGQTG